MKFLNKDNHSWLILIFIIIVLMDITIFNPGLIFSIFLAASFMYVGRKKMKHMYGKFMFWLGVFFLIISILSSTTFKLALVGLLIYAVIQFSQAKEQRKSVKPVVDNSSQTQSGEILIKKEPFLQNMCLGNQKTPVTVYGWNDINIQTGIGNCVIDLSNTVIPDDIGVISVHGLVGNITILVPYEIEVAVHHSVVSGKLSVFNNEMPKIFNQTVTYQTEQYEASQYKIKLITSVISGNVEVKRV